MTIQLSENPVLADACLKVAEKFSKQNLKTHPSTEKVMKYFASDAVFEGTCFGGWYHFNVGKTLAEWGYKRLCEESVDYFDPDLKVTFDLKSDHIVWSFESIQLRQGLLPEWLKEPQWYKINNVSKLYFQDSAEGVKISKYENLVNEWTPCAKPEGL